MNNVLGRALISVIRNRKINPTEASIQKDCGIIMFK